MPETGALRKGESMGRSKVVVALLMVTALMLPMGIAQANLPEGVTVRIRDKWHEIDKTNNVTHLHWRAVFHNGTDSALKIECTFVGSNDSVDPWGKKSLTTTVLSGEREGFHMQMQGPWDGDTGWRVNRRGCHKV